MKFYQQYGDLAEAASRLYNAYRQLKLDVIIAEKIS
jgi:hypothetical protein